MLELCPAELRHEWTGAGPGISGIAALNITAGRDGRFDALFIEDVITNSGHIALGTFARSDWRGLARAIAEQDAFCYLSEGTDVDSGGVPWPHELSMSVDTNVAIHLLAYAWAGNVFNEIAAALSQATDKQLESLTAQVSLLDKQVETELVKLMRESKSDSDVAKVISAVGDDAPFSIPTLRQGLSILEECADAEWRLMDRRWGWSVFPFGHRIDGIIERWKTLNPARSAIAGQIQMAQATGIRSYVEAYVADHRKLPVGIHRIGEPGFEVDFDVLLLSAPSGSSNP